MSSMGMPLPTPPEYPPESNADQEAYEAELSRRLHGRQDEVVDRFLELLADQCYRRDNNALAEMHELLSGPQGASIQDLYDARQYSDVGRPIDAAFARLVRYCYAVANVGVAEQVRGELSSIAFSPETRGSAPRHEGGDAMDLTAGVQTWKVKGFSSDICYIVRLNQSGGWSCSCPH